MFMLAATTASIVIFRWIGSENFASGARLKNSESYRASQAGLESVRAWLSNKGFEVGMVVTTFKEEDDDPFHLTGEWNLLADISKATKGQKFDVYLTGVEFSGKAYRLKFLSIGEARDGSKHSQVGIFEVEGLYQTEIKSDDKTINRNAKKVPPFFGMMGGGTQGIMSSGYVLGDLNAGSGFGTYNDLIVTGSSSFISGAQVGCPPKQGSGNQYSASSDPYPTNYNEIAYIDNGDTVFWGNAYIKENLRSDQAGYCGSLYVGGDTMYVNGPVTIWGDLYVEGNLILNQNLIVYGNVTVKGNITMGANASNTEFHKNFVLPNASSTYSCGGYNIKVNKGTTCKVGANAPCVSNTPTTDATCSSITGGLTLDYLGDQITTSKVDKDGNPCTSGTDCMYRIPDPLVLGAATEWKVTTIPADASCNALRGYANNNVIKIDVNLNVTNFMNAINTCHGNGAVGNWDSDADGTKWLVLRVDWNNVNNFQSETFEGNIIIVVENKPGNEPIRLPFTTKETNVLLYLTKGATTIEITDPETSKTGKHRNYFIYSEADIDKIDGSQYLEGNVFMANGTKVKEMKDPKIIANEALFEALSNAGIIADNADRCKGTKLADENGKCKDAADDDDDSDSDIDLGKKPSWPPNDEEDCHVSLTNHLKVKLQSQYVNKEDRDLEDPTVPKSCILVMPRVVYVKAGTALEKLDDYYSAISFAKDDAEEVGGTPICEPLLPLANGEDAVCTLGDKGCAISNKFLVRVRGSSP
jgi:hypothetical protein